MKNLILTLPLLASLFVSSTQTDQVKPFDLYEMIRLGDNKPFLEQASKHKYKCTFLTDLNFYNLTPLADQYRSFNFEWQEKSSYNLYFSLCNDLPQEYWCKENDGNTKIPARAVAKTFNDECVTLSHEGKGVQVDHFILDKKNNDGIKIHFQGHQQCDERHDYDLTIDIKCDPQADLIQDVNLTEQHKCFKKISFSHKSGCKIGQLSALWDWAQKHGIVIAIPFISVGFLMLFYGSKIMGLVYYICAIIFSVAVIFLAFYTTFMQTNSNDILGWIIFLGSIVVGVILGKFFNKLKWLGNFCLGFISGYGTGLMIFNSIAQMVSSYWVLWSLTLGLGLLSGGLILWLPEIMIIHSTAFFGSFFLTNGIGMVVGHYQNPFTIIEMIRKGEVQGVDPYLYFYVGGCVIFYAIGGFYQYRRLQFKKVPKNIRIRGHVLSIN